MCEKVNTDFPLFCPCPDCKHHKKTNNKITKDGVYKTKYDEKPRQIYFCHSGNHRFSETRYSDLYKKQGSFKEYEMAAKMSCHGLSQEQIAEVLERDVRTIEGWLKNIGKKSEQFHLFLCLTLKLNLFFIQMDELWSFLKGKNHQLWVFITLDNPTKFWVNFELGSRTNHTANRLVTQIKRFMNESSNQVLKVTTDKLAALTA